MDELDTLIADRFARYIAVRADKFEILRRVPIKVKIQLNIFLIIHLKLLGIRRELLDY